MRDGPSRQGGSDRETLRRVADAERHTRTVTLEVDPTSDPIQGTMRDEHGAERSFSGWVGLATALEHALDLRPPPAPGSSAKVRPERR